MKTPIPRHTSGVININYIAINKNYQVDEHMLINITIFA